MKKIESMTSDELRVKYAKCLIVQDKTSKFEYLQDEIYKELTARAHAAIYRACCWCLKNRGKNQFAAARQFADATMDEDGFFPDNDSYEIGSFYTKHHAPVVVKW